MVVCVSVCVCGHVCVWARGELKWSNTLQTPPRANLIWAAFDTHTLTVAWCWVSHPFRQLDATTHQHAAEWEVKSLSEPACTAVRLNRQDLRPLPWQCGAEQYLCHPKQFVSHMQVMLCNWSCCSGLEWPLPVQTDRWCLQAGSWEQRCSPMRPREWGVCRHGDISPGESHDRGVGGNYTVVLEVHWLFGHLDQDNNAEGQRGEAVR